MIKHFLFITPLFFAIILRAPAQDRRGTVLTEVFTSTVLKDNRVGLETKRNIKIYLPPGYATSGKPYPVVYYCHNIFTTNEQLINNSGIITLMERAFSGGTVNEFLLVVADYSNGSLGSLYENSTVSGRWLDYTTDELVPFIDNKFRTLKQKESRAVIGDFMGGRGALKLGMTHADVFSIVYALHPVATGRGYLPWTEAQINWKKMFDAKSIDELKGDVRAQIFLNVCQAYLPNTNKPPFYCDFFMDKVNNEFVPNVEKMIMAKTGFHLEETLSQSAANLKTLRGLAFDWGQFDSNQDHVYSNREFSRRLEDLGVAHEAEEYNGTPTNKVWTDNGRFYNRVLPFLANHLLFKTNN